MKKSLVFRSIAFAIVLQSIAFLTFSQVFEVDGGVGYGAVNVPKWTDLSETGSTFRLTDWSNFSGYFAGSALFSVSKSIQLGVSLGYQHLFSYEFKYFSTGGYATTYYHDVNAGRFLALARFNFGSNFVDLGIGQTSVKDGSESFTDPTAYVCFGHAFKLTENLSIPIKLSTGVLIESKPIIPILFGAGLSYKIK